MTPYALVIDDNRDVADGLCNILSMLGVQAQAAYGPRSAMLALRQHTPSLVLLDILMPGLDGFEVLAYLRREPRLADVPVFVVSTENQPESIDRALQAGAAAYILKPVSVERLESEMRKANLI